MRHTLIAIDRAISLMVQELGVRLTHLAYRLQQFGVRREWRRNMALWGPDGPA